MDLFDIPDLEPVTTPLAQFSPETRREFGLVDEQAERDAILRHLAWLRRDYLARIRFHLQSLGRPVTADDARAYFEALPDVPPPEQLNRNFLGATFKAPGWVCTGEMVCSATPGRHANRIFVWRWEGP